MSALETIRSTLARGGQHLGDVVWWTLTDARTDRATLEALWGAAQLDPALLPELPTAEKTLKTVVREAAVGQTDRLIRLGKEDSAEIVFAVVREHRHPDGSVTYQQEARIVLDRGMESLSCDSPGHDLGSLVLRRFTELRATHSSDDVRRAMLKTLEASAAVTLRDHGGIYWVPGPYAGTVRRLKGAIEKIGRSRVYLLPVHASAEAKRTLADVAQTAIDEELTALKAEIANYLATPPERVSTLARRLDAFEALRTRALLYRDILQVEVTDLEKTLGDLSRSVESLLEQKAAA